MQVNRLAFLVVTSALFGCGGGGSDYGGTTGPPPPPPGNQTLGSINTNLTSISLVAGNTQSITVSAYDTQGGVISNPGTPTFSVPAAQLAVAEVDGQGVVLGLSQGTATVTVSLTVGAVTKTATVTVNVSGTLPNSADVVASSGDYTFTPKNVAILRGGSVTWTFGALEHTVTFANTAGAPASINSGGYATTVSRSFTTAGNFSYICTLHPGMSGQVVVR